ncbi:MAG: hypothetical protein MMC23_004770 [Stictis urceolatum]|nr:hypothetical protein [Stictis urceolata]
MAAAVRLRSGGQCLFCLRGWSAPEIPRLTTPFQTQTRGKKKRSKQPPTVHVKLLHDIPGYGVILSVAPGRMRNVWYPGRKAQYVTAADLEPQRNLMAERDSGFMAEESDSIASAGSVAKPVEITLLTPTRSRELLDSLIPSHIDFHRQPIAATDQKEAPNTEEVSRNTGTAIYGSVSVQDILVSIKELLALKAAEKAHEDAARVVLSPEDIKIVQAEVKEVDIEADRVKMLGDFDIEIHVKGAEMVRRKIRIHAHV